MLLAFNLLNFFIILWATYAFLKKEIKLFVLYGLLIFQAISVIPSLIYIETGKYISEQGRMGYFVGATFFYCIFYLVSLLFIYATSNSLKPIKLRVVKFEVRNNNIENHILFIIVISVLSILLFNVYQSASPLFDKNVTRFTYWGQSKYPLLQKIFGNTAMFIPFVLGILNKKYKKSSIVLLLVYFGYNVLIGQKFSPIITGSFSFFLPIILMSTKKLKVSQIFKLKYIIIFLLAAISMYKIIYDRYDRRKPYAVIKIYDPNEAMLYRVFGLQGHLFWGATERFVLGDGDKSWNPLDLNYGMHKMMKEFATGNKESLEKHMKKGFNFSNAYPSVLFMIFPFYIAYVFHAFVIIFVLTLSGWILTKLLEHGSLVLSVVSYQFFIWTIYALTMGYFYKLKYGIIFNLLILFVSYVIEKRKLNKKNI